MCGDNLIREQKIKENYKGFVKQKEATGKDGMVLEGEALSWPPSAQLEGSSRS